MSTRRSLRRRASHFAIFAAVLAAHLLALRFFPDFRPPPEASDREPSLPITLFPEMRSRQKRPAVSRPRALPSPRRQIATASSRRPKHPSGERERASVAHAARREHPRGVRPWIDWEKEADTAVAEQSEQAAEAARRASALSRWREHVMPGPAPRPPEFRWDEARTSQRFVPTVGGLLIHLNDRCSIIVSPLALFGGCAIGHIPVYGDLFAHMDDPRPPGDTSVPQ